MTSGGRNFGSDNVAPIAPEILAAISDASGGTANSYGEDPWTQSLTEITRRIFEKDLVVYPVTTGTAANSLALSVVTPPYGGIYCHQQAHIVTDECGGPEFYSGGAKLIGFSSPDGKLRPEQLLEPLAHARAMGVHHVVPSAISLTQATEWGTVYTLAELRALSSVARSNALTLHMDGARFANALVHLGCTPAQATWKAGVDILSLGATKNGAMAAEAVIFFDAARAADFELRRKRGGHLWSKMRFLSAQLVRYLEQDLWLKNARHANAMAQRLAGALAHLTGAQLAQPVEANELFITLSRRVVAGLRAEGFEFYDWAPASTATDPLVRLVTSFVTRAADVDAFIACARKHA